MAVDNGFLGMGREHWSQVLGLVLGFGIAIAGATTFLDTQINAVAMTGIAATNRQSEAFREEMAKESDRFQTAFMTMTQRVSTLEAQHSEDARALDRLSVVVDQLRAAESGLADSVTKMQAVIESSGLVNGKRR